MKNLLLLGEVAEDSASMSAFVDGIVSGVTSHITLTMVATTVASIVGAGIVAIFAWKFGRKGYNFVKNALSGKGGRF